MSDHKDLPHRPVLPKTPRGEQREQRNPDPRSVCFHLSDADGNPQVSVVPVAPRAFCLTGEALKHWHSECLSHTHSLSYRDWTFDHYQPLWRNMICERCIYFVCVSRQGLHFLKTDVYSWKSTETHNYLKLHTALHSKSQIKFQTIFYFFLVRWAS